MQGRADLGGSVVPAEGEAQRAGGIRSERFVGVRGAVQADARGDGVLICEDKGQLCDVHFLRGDRHDAESVVAVLFADDAQQPLRFKLAQSV